jgi:hypothetical protein
MRNLRSIYSLATLLVLGACGDDGTSLDTVGLEGTWNATVIEFTDNANSQNVVDLIQRDGASFTLVVDATGTASSTFDDGVGGTSSDSGTLNSDATTLTLGGQTFDATRNGDVLTLVDPGELFDFGSGSEVAATLRIVLSR